MESEGETRELKVVGEEPATVPAPEGKTRELEVVGEEPATVPAPEGEPSAASSGTTPEVLDSGASRADTEEAAGGDLSPSTPETLAPTTAPAPLEPPHLRSYESLVDGGEEWAHVPPFEKGQPKEDEEGEPDNEEPAPRSKPRRQKRRAPPPPIGVSRPVERAAPESPTDRPDPPSIPSPAGEKTKDEKREEKEEVEEVQGASVAESAGLPGITRGSRPRSLVWISATPSPRLVLGLPVAPPPVKLSWAEEVDREIPLPPPPSPTARKSGETAPPVQAVPPVVRGQRLPSCHPKIVPVDSHHPRRSHTWDQETEGAVGPAPRRRSPASPRPARPQPPPGPRLRHDEGHRAHKYNPRRQLTTEDYEPFSLPSRDSSPDPGAPAQPTATSKAQRELLSLQPTRAERLRREEAERKKTEERRIADEKRAQQEREEQSRAAAERQLQEERRRASEERTRREKEAAETPREQRAAAGVHPAESGRRPALPVRLTGVRFSGLRPIPTDRVLDPPPRSCFNCWCEGHRRGDCPRPQVAVYCTNCGRRGVETEDCPRCASAFRALMAELGRRQVGKAPDPKPSPREETPRPRPPREQPGEAAPLHRPPEEPLQPRRETGTRPKEYGPPRDQERRERPRLQGQTSASPGPEETPTPREGGLPGGMGRMDPRERANRLVRREKDGAPPSTLRRPHDPVARESRSTTGGSTDGPVLPAAPPTLTEEPAAPPALAPVPSPAGPADATTGRPAPTAAPSQPATAAAPRAPPVIAAQQLPAAPTLSSTATAPLRPDEMLETLRLLQGYSPRYREWMLRCLYGGSTSPPPQSE